MIVLIVKNVKDKKPDQIIPACAKQGEAGRWANLACLCVPARRREDIGYRG